MVKAKVGGIVLGGFAAYLILSKGLNVLNNCVRNMCVAHEWKNYYKYGKEGNMVPPGYAMHTRKNSDGDNVDTGAVEALKKQEQGTQNKSVGGQIAEAIVKAVTDVFAGEKEPEEASEGQTEPCERSEQGLEGQTEPCERSEQGLEGQETASEEDESYNETALDFSNNPDGEFVGVDKGVTNNETDSD